MRRMAAFFITDVNRNTKPELVRDLCRRLHGFHVPFSAKRDRYLPEKVYLHKICH